MSVINQIKAIFPESCWPDVWLVGGTVRDILLNQPVQDIDLVAAIPPAQLETIGFRPISPVSSTPICFKHVPEIGKIEVTVIDAPSQLEHDLHRRDFTINALAMDLNGILTDPLGGQADLVTKQLRVCSDSSLQEDPIRIFRAFRFAADGWNLHPETLEQLAAQQWNQAFSTIPVKRFSRELQKALAKEQPERFFTLMLHHRIGEYYLPELFSMPNIPAGPLEHHPEGDLMTHCMQVLQRAALVSTDPLTRFCAFFHDIGKLTSAPACYPKHYGHDEAGFKPAFEMCKRLHLPANWGKALAWVSRLHTHLNRWSELRNATRLRIAEQALKAGISEILTVVSAADKPGNSTPALWFHALAVAAMSSSQLGTDTHRLETMPTAHRTGYLLQQRIALLNKCQLVSADAEICPVDARKAT